MIANSEHNCVTTFANGIHPLKIGGPPAPKPIVPGGSRIRGASRLEIVNFLRKNPGSDSSSISIHLGICKSSTCDQLLKLINLKLVAKWKRKSPHGLPTFSYELTK